MKKRTINRILICIIVFLIVAICVLIVQIANRPRYTATTEAETATIIEIPQSEAIPVTQETQQAGEEAPNEDNDSLKRGKTSSKVNIRELPSEDARVLDTVEEGTEFNILEILDTGWTKIQYEEQEAYISSSYVILIQ